MRLQVITGFLRFFFLKPSAGSFAIPKSLDQWMAMNTFTWAIPLTLAITNSSPVNLQLGSSLNRSNEVVAKYETYKFVLLFGRFG